MSKLLPRIKKILLSPCAAMLYVSACIHFICSTLGHTNPFLGALSVFTSPLISVFNILIIAVTYLPALFFRRRIFASTVISALWLTLGITNCVLLHLRGTPLTAVDFTIFTDGITLMDSYLSPLMIVLIILVFVFAGGVMAAVFIKCPKFKVRPVYSLICFFSVFAITAALFFTFLNVGQTERKFSDLRRGYEKYGFAYCFALSAFDTGIDQPTDYSEKSVNELLQILSPDDSSAPKTPNIIFYQMESFLDPSRIKGIELSRDPIPVFSSLKEKCPGGKLYVSTIGGGTANTEFEVLTGIDLTLFGLGEYPYTTVLKNAVPSSVCYDLSEHGYTSFAIHNHSGSFYGRNTVFEKMGFDCFQSIEYMGELTETTPVGWAKDLILTQEIRDCITSTETRDFVFAISVEGHGKYPHDIPWPNGSIKVSGAGELTPEYEYYVNMISDMDAALGELVRYVDSLNEPTVLVAYGDHLPALELTDEMITSGGIFASEYVIYTNAAFDGSFESKDLEAYGLYPHVVSSLGIEGSAICRLNTRLKGAEGFSSAMQTLAYDILYGEREAFEGVPPAKEKGMRMGLDKIKITDVFLEGGSIQIIGENFTEYSTVYIGPWKQDTVYIDSTHLVCDSTWSFLSDSLYVSQVSSDGEKLSVTEDFPIPAK